MKKYLNKRLLSLVLAIVMCLGLALPAGAVEASDDPGVIVEKVDNSAVSVKLNALKEMTGAVQNLPLYADTETVRVSIVLSEKSTLEMAMQYGISTVGIASNATAMSYREQLAQTQADMTQLISNRALGGETLDVAWNLTLAANIISANVKYGQIKAIEAIPGVEKVFIETRYDPTVVSKGGDDPNMATSPAQIGSTIAYLEGYTGAGSRIAVIDTGTDTDHQSFDNGAFLYALEQAGKSDVDLLDVADIAAVLDQLHVAERYPSLTAESLYLNEKLPFGFNYVDVDTNITHDRDTQGEHGSHVAGIATANRYIPDGEGGYAEALDAVYVQGVAPDAQLITMKVFGASGGAYDSDYMVAIEDAIILGADAINLSLGSSVAGMTTSEDYQHILDMLSETDTVVVMSAGNNGSWADNTYYGVNGYPYLWAEDVNFHTGGSPGTYTNSLGVASVDNSGFTALYVEVDGAKIDYAESLDYGNRALATLAGEHEFVFLNSIGTDAEFAAISDMVAGKIALCYRGDTSFFEKANAAVAAGAIGVIIVNNQPGVIYLNLTGYNYTVPVVSITQVGGEMFKVNPVTEGDAVLYWTGTMNISDTLGVDQYGSEYYSMSSFSSWGVPGDLSLKPEITAPGGNIYSVFGSARSPQGAVIGGSDQYELMSGTSMAAPQVTGMMAVLMQYIRENELSVDGLTDRALAQSLLMSTAVPMRDGSSGGEYYPVLQQGAGLANVGAAVQANSYILMGNDATDSAADGKVKVELGDDPTKTGEYEFSFTINNLTGETQYYTLSADFFTQDMFYYPGMGTFLDTWTTGLNADVTWLVNGEAMEMDSSWTNLDFNGDGIVNTDDGQILLDYATGEVTELTNAEYADLDGDEDIDSHDAYLFFANVESSVVVVPAAGSAAVTVQVELDDANLEYYPNGAYVEGFVYVECLATDEGVEGETHSIPVLGFYGNWTDASMYDDAGYLYEYTGGQTNLLTIKFAGDPTEWIFGGNPMVPDAVYMPERDALSSKTGDQLAKYYFSSIRNAGNSLFLVSDAETGEAYIAEELGALYAAAYSANTGRWSYTQNSLNLGWNGEGIPDDTVINVSLVLAPEYYANADGSYRWNELGSGAYLTTTMTIDNTAPVIGEDSVVIDTENGELTFSVSDNQYVAAAALFDVYGQYLYTYEGSKADAQAGDTVEYVLDLSKVNGPSFLLQVYDYAGNASTYKITQQIGEVTETIDGVAISEESLTLIKGNTAQLIAMVMPVNAVNRDIIWESLYEDVATVDENGVVTAVSDGMTLITATSVADPTKAASCLVTVISVDYTISGVLQDADGYPMSFTWNLAEDSTWSKVADLTLPIGSVAGTGTEYAFVMDSGTTEISLVDTTSGEILGTTAPVGDPFWDMSYSYLSPVYGTDCLNTIFSSWVLFAQDPSAPDFVGFNMASYLSQYSGASYLVGIESLGLYQDDKGYFEELLVLDNAGCLWIVDFYFQIGSLSFGYIPTNLNANYDLSYDFAYCSLVMSDDGEAFFFSQFDGDTNNIYMFDSNFDAYLIGNVGDGVWPAALTGAYVNAASSAQNAFENLEMAATWISVEEELKVAPITIEPAAASGSLNAVVNYNTPVRPMSDTSVTDNEATVTLTVTAKDAEGNDVDSTNGVVTVTYDAESLTLSDVVVNGDYESIVIDTENGTVTIGYVSMNAIPAGNPVATLTFDVVVTNELIITVDHKETGSAEPDYEEAVELSYEHSYGEWYEAEAPTCTEPGEERRDCEYCDDYETREIPATGHSYGEWVETKAPTCTEPGEERRDCDSCDAYETREIPANGHSYGGWYQTKSPNFVAAGEERRDCEHCDSFETRPIPALPGAPTIPTPGPVDPGPTVPSVTPDEPDTPVDPGTDDPEDPEVTTNPDGSTTTTTTDPETGAVTEVTENVDGSTTTVVTEEDGTVTTTEEDAEGTVTETVENTDGSSETTVTTTDGASSTTTVSAEGTVSAEVELPAEVVDEAVESGETVVLPMPAVTATEDSETAPTVTVTTGSEEEISVEIPVENATSGTVAIIVNEDGSETIVIDSYVTDTGVVADLPDGATVKIVDNAKDFADVDAENNWFAEAVDFASARGLVTGVTEDVFGHEATTSRAMVWTLLARMAGVDTTGGNTWYEIGQKWAMENGISDGTDPTGSATREQLVTMLWRFVGEPDHDHDLTGYSDHDEINDWTREALEWAVGTGLVQGGGDKSLNPQGEATRAQLAQLIMNFMEAN